MAIQYGDILYNPNGLVVAALNDVAKTYSTPVVIERFGDLDFEFTVDEDEIKSGGLFTDALRVPTKVTGTLRDAALNWTALTAMAGIVSESVNGSSSPDAVRQLDYIFGGEGLGYFGAIAAVAGTNGSNALIGFAKSQLGTYPSFSMAQNEFRRAETPIHVYPPSTTIRKGIRVRVHETATSIPTSQSAFQAFFSGLFDA
ncbi:MAG: hypothetical protein K8L99_13440 [Anaerolineae bacterium]|nr:hypothetical protein [Anaerolineae bacterium]